MEELKKGIKLFQSAYKFNGDLKQIFEKDRHFEKLVEQKEIDQMKTENKFFKFIVEEEL
ncbi:hypothetical protein [Maribacter polysaccharolyticus]|uniref:hypothetical protein n=1 Tax=Maribacter polysaccharolyticus TaxID=3020831 RepID=UPI00237FBF97|nr:hypothetical protein [Maribacter polysaccharolyticus]MDE3744150.1 hypothetical protein [Maribacter polysaccharolyticus]